MKSPLFVLLWVTPLLFGADSQTNAWDILNRGLADTNPLKRAQAITALGGIGPMEQVLDLAEAALLDKDSSVRQTAAAVLGEMKARRAQANLRKALDDESPEVSFTAAKALWDMGDRSGREIFWQVLAGERSPSEGAIKGGVHNAKKQLHNPRGLALMGIKEGAGALLGPFSLGVGLAEELIKDKSAPARALSAQLLATDPDPNSGDELERALTDKNAVVRAAVARSLGARSSRDALPKLEPLLADANDAVRYNAAAAVIRLSQPARRRPKVQPPAKSAK
ncbi:MAG TPA: HEAT repeat domain-containing protein [Bryobacteraceae bacterium]|nr:HEAT repeat domain-containing protein [Bryobacteraceae bacterium]